MVFCVCVVLSDSLLMWLYVIFDVVVFFFKQKTAYEMRISDWSSDVCSSDLVGAAVAFDAVVAGAARHKVGPRPAAKCIIAEAARKRVIGAAAVQYVGAGIARQRNVAAGAIAQVIASGADARVIRALADPVSSGERRVGKAWDSTCRSWG